MGNSAESAPLFGQEGGKEYPDKIFESDISKEAPPQNGTKLILQRHGKYERSIDAENAGGLTDEAIRKIEQQGYDLLSSILNSLPEEERANIDVLFIGSNTRYGIDEDLGQRSMETAEQMMNGMTRAIEEYGLDVNQILNKNENFNINRQENDDSLVRPDEGIVEPQIFSNDAKFAKFISEQIGEPIGSIPFWQAYESDRYKAEREEAGIEGPHEIADRMQHFVEKLTRYARRYHSNTKNKSRRLVILAASHYDTISPFVKDKIFNMSEDESNNIFVGVDYGGGISIDIDPEIGDLVGKVIIDGEEYSVDLSGETKKN